MITDLVLALGLPASFAFLLVVLLLGSWYSQDRSRKNYPPGPFALPVFGNLLTVGRRSRDMYLYVSSLSKRYGDITSLYFGKQLVVFLNSYDVIKEATVHQSEKFSSRPRTIRIWQEMYKQKDLSAPELSGVRNLFKVAFSHPSLNMDQLEMIVMKEILSTSDQIRSLAGRPFDPTDHCKRLFSHAFYRMLFGERYDFTGPMFKELNSLLYEYMENLRVELSENFLPILQLIKPTSSANRMKNTIENIHQILDKILGDHKATFDSNQIDDVLSILLECQQKNTAEYSDAMIKHSINNILLAAVESTQVVMRWLLLYFIRFPHVLKRCQQEIDEVVDDSQSVSIHHRSRLPYIQATILETLRHANIAPLGAPRSTTEDTILNGYFIPKETIVFLNIYAVHMDDKHWTSPREFNPDRWIQDGTIVKTEKFIPFSLGPRFCPGSQLAKMQLFLAVSYLIKEFDFNSCGDIPQLDGIQKMSLTPRPYKIIAVSRSKGHADAKTTPPIPEVYVHQYSKIRESNPPAEPRAKCANKSEPLAVLRTQEILKQGTVQTSRKTSGKPTSLRSEADLFLCEE